MQKSLVTVVIPVYLQEPTELEKVSLTQTLEVLGRYPITFMAPTTLDTTWYENYCRGKADIYVERFEWKGHTAFSKLFTNSEFYKRFLKYQYMLICHLDAFVFRDELEKWCHSGYDYIGTVVFNNSWNNGKPTRFRKLASNSIARKIGITPPPEYHSNNGFAIKNVSTFYHMTSKFKLFMGLYYRWIKIRKTGLLADFFMTQYFPVLSSKFKMPSKVIAQQFGAEYVDYEEKELPFACKEEKNLPFGVHGWIQYRQEYWLPCIRKYGHNV